MSSELSVAKLELRFPTNTLALVFAGCFLLELSDDLRVGCFADSTKLLSTGLTCLDEDLLLLWFECVLLVIP